MENYTNRQKMLDAHEMINDYFFSGLLSNPDIIFYKSCLMGDDYAAYDVDNVPKNIDPTTLEVLFGYYETDYNIIGLTVCNNMLITLAHEIIHQYQHEFNIDEPDHGREFRRMARYMEITLNLNKGDI